MSRSGIRSKCRVKMHVSNCRCIILKQNNVIVLRAAKVQKLLKGLRGRMSKFLKLVRKADHLEIVAMDPTW